eukprot:143138-Amorphochlora_amoeboformis.AAC.4
MRSYMFDRSEEIFVLVMFKHHSRRISKGPRDDNGEDVGAGLIRSLLKSTLRSQKYVSQYVQYMRVLEINEPQWADMLLRMHQQEVKVGSPGVYIFNMTGAKARVGGLGMDNVADYPTSRTPFRFVTWKFIREKLE